MVYIPGEVKTLLKEQGYSSEPDVVVRALNSLGGDLGEAYLLLANDAAVIFSRQIGKSFTNIEIPIANITDVNLIEDRPFAYLNFKGDDSDYSLKFSGLDADSLKALVERLNCTVDLGDPNVDLGVVDSTETTVELTPVIGFCAAVYAMIQADSSIDDDELELLNRLIDHPPTVLKGLDALRRLGTVDLFAQLDSLMEETQKLCMMANLVEMAMVDGLVRGQERRLLSQVREAVGVEKENFDAIFEVLMIKNNRSVFEILD